MSSRRCFNPMARFRRSAKSPSGVRGSATTHRFARRSSGARDRPRGYGAWPPGCAPRHPRRPVRLTPTPPPMLNSEEYARRRRLPMCGIAGFVRLDQPAQRSLVQAMCDQIRHRGPDDEGIYIDRGCGIGMRRLSIIDLSTGHQPMSNEEGWEGLKRLRGMFAFAIWDARQDRLLLARDRFGKKPLYFAALPTGIYFGSELSCLGQAGVPLETDPEALRLYFQFNYIPDPLTAYRAIRRVPAGGWLTYQRGTVRQGRY